jgi:hypothetical protein
MSKDFIGYQALTDNALRSVVREALRRVAKQGLVGSHHFYLTFKTKFPGVDIPDFLVEQYPDEMTIVLQHQFWGLKITEDHFEVTLTFRKLPAELSIPFAALTTFFDPGVQFGLQFKGGEETQGALSANTSAETAAIKPDEKRPGEKPPAIEKVNAEKANAEKPEAAGEKPPPQPGEVVSLDAFRKK